MVKQFRLAFSLIVLLSGLALVPFVELPTETFRWQRYVGVYEDPLLEINYVDGAPGSFFAITGSNYPPDSILGVIVNGQQLGLITTDSAGGFVFRLDTAVADPGPYTVVMSVSPNVETGFDLNWTSPIRTIEGVGPIFLIPSGFIPLDEAIYLPLMQKD